jgi:hypothetical protein
MQEGALATYRDAERLRSLEIDDELELGGLFDWQAAWLGTLEDLIYVSRRSADRSLKSGR